MFLYRRKDSRFWYLGWRENGQQKAKALHKYLNLPFGITKKGAAQKLFARIMADAIDQKVGLIQGDDSPRVEEFYRLYLTYCDQNKKPKTARMDYGRLRRWLRFLENEKIHRLSEIGLKTFREFADRELKKSSNATKNRYGSIVRASLNWAVREGYLKDNPLKNLVRLKEVRPSRAVSFDRRDLEKLFSIEDEIFLAYLKIIYYTLMRRSEALNLTWRDVDLRRKMIHIRQTKTDRSRTVPISPKLVSTLKNLSRNGDRLFVWSENATTKKFQALKRGLDLKIDSLHHFRHLGASKLLQAGANPRAVQELLGHRTVRTTMEIYGHVSAEGLRETVSKL